MRVKRNLDELIYDKMVDSIIAAQWSAGEVISVEEIAARYEVSRTPVVQAIKRMCIEEIVELLPNGRVRFPCSTIEQIRDVCATRVMMEEKAGEILCGGDARPDCEALRQMIEECGQCRRDGNYLRAGQLDREFHRAIVGAAGNSYLETLYGLVQKKFLTINYLNRPAETVVTEAAAKEHFAILDALEKRDYPEYCRQVRRHLEAIQTSLAEKKPSSRRPEKDIYSEDSVFGGI